MSVVAVALQEHGDLCLHVHQPAQDMLMPHVMWSDDRPPQEFGALSISGIFLRTEELLPAKDDK